MIYGGKNQLHKKCDNKLHIAPITESISLGFYFIGCLQEVVYF